MRAEVLNLGITANVCQNYAGNLPTHYGMLIIFLTCTTGYQYYCYPDMTIRIVGRHCWIAHWRWEAVTLSLAENHYTI